MPLITIYLDENGKNTVESALATVVRGGECWSWPLGREGCYKSLIIDKKKHFLHRLVYEQLVGEIPKGYEIDHLCLNPSCCNPKHLEAVPKAENIRRGNSMSARWARRTHCEQGHPFDEENTRIYHHHGQKIRKCAACLYEKQRARYERREAKKGRTPAKGMPNGSPTCKRGHAFDEANTRVNRDGRRRCKACEAMRSIKSKIARKGQVAKLVKAVCLRGHSRSGDNLYTSPAGVHQCRECKRLRNAKQNDKRREQRRAEAAAVP